MLARWEAMMILERRTATAGALVLAAAWLAGCAAAGSSLSPAAKPSGAIGRGEAVARAQCADCHAVGSEGQSYLADAPVFGEIARRYPAARLGQALETISAVGHVAMPPRNLTRGQIQDLDAYLRSLAVDAPRNPRTPRP
jgi:cytochrome c